MGRSAIVERSSRDRTRSATWSAFRSRREFARSIPLGDAYTLPKHNGVLAGQRRKPHMLPPSDVRCSSHLFSDRGGSVMATEARRSVSRCAPATYIRAWPHAGEA